MYAMIEKYHHEGEGYAPLLIRDGWQLAQLNFVPHHGLDDMDEVEVHALTDEAFVLLDGMAVLVAARREKAGIAFECVRMEPGVTYNIPAGTWHNIGMRADARMVIVERSRTHLHDVEHRPLTQTERDALRRAVEAVL